MQGYVDINAASELTSKHKDTIRRLIKQNPKSQYIIKGRQGQYLISKDWLLDQYALTPAEPTSTETTQQDKQAADDNQATSNSSGATQGLYETLAKQLESKDQQIAELQKLLHEKEANNTKINDQFQQLMGRFLLPSNTPTSEPAEQGATVEPKPAYAEPVQVKTDTAPAKKPKTTKQKTTRKPQVKAKPRTKVTTNQVKKATPAKKRRWFGRS